MSDRIEDALAARHLAGGTLVLYDVSSAAFEGRTCPLGAIGHPKDGCGAACRSSTGCSPAKTASRSPSKCSRATPATVASQVAKVRDRFGITRVVLAGDRGSGDSCPAREQRCPPPAGEPGLQNPG